MILARLGQGRGRRALLDVGAADGFLSELLTAQGWRVTALERDPAQAERARGRCEEVVVADLEEAAHALLHGDYDVIVYGDVLEHLKDPGAALDAPEPNRLRPRGAVVVVSVPNVAHLWVRVRASSSGGSSTPTGASSTGRTCGSSRGASFRTLPPRGGPRRLGADGDAGPAAARRARRASTAPGCEGAPRPRGPARPAPLPTLLRLPVRRRLSEATPP